MAGRPVSVTIQPGCRPMHTSLNKMLRRQLESTQYLAIRYSERLDEEGAVTSVGSKGDSYDNALAETVNGLYKTELIRRRGPWRTVDHLEVETAKWVDWWNNRQLHGFRGDIPPAEYEANYYRAIEEATAAA
jgi:transposase InsO family protein